ncbi:hypothetical protein ACFPYI_14495 [Halomarina salina]|uniref:Uncharacterized protein n=1 Tax=Halomarina salina TaxID=1872699 RepID=A0ABD5RPV1_9EURY|nr:hypothetical protein [Halomarina salina]
MTDTPSRFGRIGIALLAVLAVVAGGTAVTAQEADGGQPTVELVAAGGGSGPATSFDVVASNVSGVGAYEYTVGVADDENATITRVTPGGNPPSFLTTVEYSDNRTSAFVRVAGADTNDSGPVSIGTVEFSEAVEREDLSLTVAALGDEQGESYDVRVPEPSESAYYQVDFVGGAPIEELGENATYSGQDRLLKYLHGSTEEPVTRVGGPFADENLTQCVTVESFDVADDEATVEFTVAAGCDLDLSLVSYEKTGPGWNASTASEQVLYDDAQGTFGPGNHTMTVELPGDPGTPVGDASDDSSTGSSDESTTESSGDSSAEASASAASPVHEVLA